MEKSQNHTARIILLLLVLVLGFFAFKKCGHSQKEEPAAPIDTMRVLVRQIQDCSRLYTTEIDVKKLIVQSGKSSIDATVLGKKLKWDIPGTGRYVAIPLEATLKAYVDFSDFSEKNIKRKGDKLEVILPDPKIMLTQTKVNHEAIKKHEDWLSRNYTDEEMMELTAQGRSDIMDSIPKMNIIPTAKEGAAKVLVPLFEQVGFKAENITITFREEFKLDKIKRLIVND